MIEKKLSVTIRSDPGAAASIFTIKGVMDSVTFKQVDDQLLPVINEGSSNIVLDLTNLEYVSSVGIMCLIRYNVLMMNKQKKFLLVRPPDPVLNTLKISGIVKYFDIYENAQEALAALN